MKRKELESLQENIMMMIKKFSNIRINVGRYLIIGNCFMNNNRLLLEIVYEMFWQKTVR